MARIFVLWIVAACLGAGMGGCAKDTRHEGAVEAARSKRSPPGEGAVIGHLAMRDRMVTICAGGPRFTIESRDGRALQAGLSLEGLQAKDPSAALLYRTGIAGKGAVLDASLWAPAEEGRAGGEAQQVFGGLKD